jgi:2,3-bisphosphoglycerate-independent phosphoglycerate mutase
VKWVGAQYADPIQWLQASYDNAIYDEFIEPILVSHDNNQYISDGSIVVVTNFRTDRGRELVAALNQSDHDEQNMKALDLTMITMTNYDDSFHDVQVLAPRQNLTMTLGEVLSLAGKTQLRIAETEKYPHVTFFFSWGQETEFAGEHRIVVPSPKVATYDLQPEMSAPAVTQSAIDYITNNQPDFIALNWANTDMVWHTWMMDAAVKAAEAVDAGLGQLMDATLPLWYTWIVIADHGNADIIMNEDGSPHTAHTLNPVPCIIASQEPMNITLSEGKLADIAPTILKLMSVEQSSAMDGISLI